MTFAATYANQHPDQIAIRDEHQALTWSEVDDALNRCVSGLKSLDLGADVRVAVFAENSVETALANLAGLVAGVAATVADRVAAIAIDAVAVAALVVGRTGRAVALLGQAAA